VHDGGAWFSIPQRAVLRQLRKLYGLSQIANLNIMSSHLNSICQPCICRFGNRASIKYGLLGFLSVRRFQRIRWGIGRLKVLLYKCLDMVPVHLHPTSGREEPSGRFVFQKEVGILSLDRCPPSLRYRFAGVFTSALITAKPWLGIIDSNSRN
jgi:hypothetical protein